MAQRAQESPGETAQVITETPFPLEGMILHQPIASAAALSSDLDRAVALVENSDPVVAPPARIIYRLIAAAPHLVATLLIALEQRGQGDVAAESLAYFAYDKIRSERYPQLPISLTGGEGVPDGDHRLSVIEVDRVLEAARRIMAAVSKETVRALMPSVPVQSRSVLQPEILLARLDVIANRPAPGHNANSLLQRQGASWLQTRLGEVAALYRQRTSDGEVAPDFLTRYRETLEAAANTSEPEARGRLMGIIGALSF